MAMISCGVLMRFSVMLKHARSWQTAHLCMLRSPSLSRARQHDRRLLSSIQDTVKYPLKMQEQAVMHSHHRLPSCLEQIANYPEPLDERVHLITTRGLYDFFMELFISGCCEPSGPHVLGGARNESGRLCCHAQSEH